MDIQTQQLGARRVVNVAGRLDGHWADHLTRHLELQVREGHHDLLVDLSAVEYISSAGVRVLLTAHRQLRQVEGRFAVARPSLQVRKVLELIGLHTLIALEGESAPAEEAKQPEGMRPAARERTVGSTRLEVHALAEGAMQARLVGRPERFAECRFEAADCTPVRLPADTLAVGVGAFGEGFEACRELFGDFLAAAGAVVVQPGAVGMRCDHLLAEGAYVPEVQALYSLVCAGPFTRLLRFEPLAQDTGTTGTAPSATPLSTLIEAAMAEADAPAVCLAVVAESGGLIGAGLRRSPAAAGAQGTRPTQFPQVREWLSLSTERLDAGSTVVVLGVVADPARLPEAARAFLRPMAAGARAPLHAHLHAAAFRHRPLPRGRIALEQVLPKLVDSGTASGVLHLLTDDRDPAHPEESRFVRGACWVAPLHFTQEGR